jgi:hypothetical protein
MAAAILRTIFETLTVLYSKCCRFGPSTMKNKTVDTCTNKPIYTEALLTYH